MGTIAKIGVILFLCYLAFSLVNKGSLVGLTGKIGDIVHPKSSKLIEIINPQSSGDKIITNLSNNLESLKSLTRKLGTSSKLSDADKTKLYNETTKLINQSQDLVSGLKETTKEVSNKNLLNSLAKKVIPEASATPTHSFQSVLCPTP